MATKKCLECNKDYDGFYCKPCNSRPFRDNFPKWTSGDDNIDKLIQDSQLNANYGPQCLEWIEYSNLKDIEHFAEGGFGSVFKAVWKDGRITNKWNLYKKTWYYWDVQKSEWRREGETEVALKKYRNATSVSSEFLNEVNKTKVINLNDDYFK